MNINVNIEELIRSMDKLNIYRSNESTSFSKMISLFNNISFQYNGPLNGSIKEVNDGIYNNFKNIRLNHETDINYISMNITKYNEATIYTRSTFDKIGDIK